jgi:hypothetical protein
MQPLLNIILFNPLKHYRQHIKIALCLFHEQNKDNHIHLALPHDSS